MNQEQLSVIDRYLASLGSQSLSSLSMEQHAQLGEMLLEIDKRTYNEPGSPQDIAKRFEENPQAYDGLIRRDPTQLDWYQSEVRRLAKIDEISRPPDRGGRRIAADAAQRLAKKLQDADPSLSDLDALSKAYEQSPELYVR